jgi:hypothetical protein
MNHMKLVKILELIRPKAQWVLRGDTLADLEWVEGQVQVKPTQTDIDAGEAQVDALAYQDLRKPEYPYYGDQLDALWKGLQVLKSNGVVIGAEAEAMIATVQAVKDKYPKPS